MRKDKTLIHILLLVILSLVFLFSSTSKNKINAQGAIMLYDNFEDGDSEGWTEYTFNGDWYINNGEYWGTASPSGSYRKNSYTTAGDKNWKNYRYSVKVRSIEEDDADKIIFFYFDEKRSAYEINLRSKYATSDGNDIVLFKSPDLDTTDGKILDIKSFENHPNMDYEITVEVRNVGEDVHIKVYVNGNVTPVIDYIDKKTDQNTPIYNGAVGLLIWTQTPHTTAFDNVIVENLDIPSPTPTPTPTPANKVILTPGMGASWNTDAILNCKLEDYSGNWNIAPFAENIYKPIITTLSENGFEVIPFYYDWRKRIPSHFENIQNLINSNNEKVSFVGHSMGGLVGRVYIENEQETNNKIDKYISVGSPHQGTALAYPAWYGGVIWNNSLTTKIAATLLIKRCSYKYSNKMETVRNVIPSFQDLLPTYPFLKDNKGNIRDIKTNEWLLNSSFPQNTNATIATLSGFGFDTLLNIKVKKPTKKEKQKGLWEEGKPTGREFTTEGDGTIISNSAKIEGLDNLEINQNHSGLITSQEGINTILNFLKGEPAESLSILRTTETIEEPKSALVIIAYPSTFISIDEKGKIKKDKHNVIAKINPKSGKYRIGILPLDKDSILLIGQFLKDGKYSWKEYKIKGRLPFLKTIRFEEDNLIENPLE